MPDGHPGWARREDRIRAEPALRPARGVAQSRPLRLDQTRSAPMARRRVVADELMR